MMNNVTENEWVSVIKFGVKNSNGRIYPIALKDEIYSQIKKKIDYNRCLITSVDDSTIIDMTRVCGIVTEVKVENDEIHIKYSFLETPMGKLMKECNKSSYITASGIGSLNGDTVSDDYEFIKFQVTPTSSTW